MKKKLKLPLSIFELVSYSLLCLLGIWGLVYIILGFVCYFLPAKNELLIMNNAIAANTKGMGFMYQGFLIMGLAVVAAVIILLVNAKQSDRDYEKAQRRAARLAKDIKKDEVVDVDAEPVK